MHYSFSNNSTISTRIMMSEAAWKSNSSRLLQLHPQVCIKSASDIVCIVFIMLFMSMPCTIHHNKPASRQAYCKSTWSCTWEASKPWNHHLEVWKHSDEDGRCCHETFKAGKWKHSAHFFYLLSFFITGNNSMYSNADKIKKNIKATCFLYYFTHTKWFISS